MEDKKEFIEYLKEERIQFARVASHYDVTNHLILRTQIDSLLIAYDQAVERLSLFDVSVSLPDIDNYQYLKGFADACGVNWDLADKDDYPEGLNNYNEVIDRVYELKGKMEEIN